MNAEIVAVGSEMLTPQKTDTNSLYLTDQLNSLGVEVVLKYVVGDSRERLAEIIDSAAKRSQIVIVTGGLGPTEDDVTRDAVALATGRQMRFEPVVFEAISELFRRHNRRMADINKRQAFVIDGADVLPNERGTAPGQWLDTGAASIVLLPGPPKELKGMWEQQCMPRLQAKLPPQVLRTRFFRVAGMSESELDQLIAPVYTRYENPACTILAASGDIQIHLRARCDSAERAEALLEEVATQLVPLLGDRLYSRDGRPLEAHLGAMLASSGRTLSVAESCTGGLVAARITEVPGSSAYFKGGFLTYSDDSKHQLLGVDPELIVRCTAVSGEVAEAMAAGARDRLATDFAVSITGVAGPEGGSDATPVGTVFIGLASPDGVTHKRFHFLRDRAWVRTMATNAALDLLRLHLLHRRP